MPTTINGSGITFPDTTSITTNLIPAGTKMIFRQTVAPTGWTKDSTYNDYALRIVNGTISQRTTGVAFSSAFASRTPQGTVPLDGVSIGSQTAAGTVASASTGVTVSGGGNTGSTSITPTGTVGGTISGTTIPVDPVGSKHGVTGTASQGGTISSTTATGTISSETVTLNSHDHTTNSVQVASDPPDTTVLSDVYATTVTAQTHSHTFTGTSHSHSFTGDLHSHDIFLYNNGSHNHGFSGSFTGNSASHSHSVTLSDSGHSHTFTGTPHSHSLSGTTVNLNGSAMDFSVNYVDCIIATKD